MTSSTMNLARWILGRPKQFRGLFMGLDGVGKTSLLYQLLLGELVRTIPTIGFNVETVSMYRGNELTLWDVGGIPVTDILLPGCDKIRPLYRHYFQNSDFVLFVFDANDQERFEEAVEEIIRFLPQMEPESIPYMWIAFNKQDLIAEGEIESRLKSMRDRVESVISNFTGATINIVDIPGFSATTDTHVRQLFEEISRTVEQYKKTSSKPGESKEKTGTEKSGATANAPDTSKSLAELRELITAAVQTDTDSPAVFWDKFRNADLPVWDHYNHLKAGYFVLLDGFSWGQTVMQSAETFIGHLSRLREAKPERFRNTTHRTMTIFWLYHLQVATLAYRANEKLESLPSRGDFGKVLLHTPLLMDSGLWKSYYTKDAIFTPEARESWRLPDITPLPAFTPEIASASKKPPVQPTNQNYNHLIRFALNVVQQTIGTKVRRGSVLKYALPALQSSIMRLRVEDPSIVPYSVTQAYFWIQFTHSALASIESNQNSVESSDPASLSWQGSLKSLTLSAFIALFGVTGNEWQTYYSADRWDSLQARIQFSVPDKKPLSDIIKVHSPQDFELAREKMSESSIFSITSNPEMPTPQLLGVLAAAVCDEVADWSESDWDNDMPKTHAELIFSLYNYLLSDDTYKQDVPRTKRINDAFEVIGPAADGVTARAFWIQQVLNASSEHEETPSNFDDFIIANPHLAFSRLYKLYYSDVLWESMEASIVFIPPDRKSLASIVGGGGQLESNIK